MIQFNQNIVAKSLHQARPLMMESGLAWCGTQKLGVEILNEKKFLDLIK